MSEANGNDAFEADDAADDLGMFQKLASDVAAAYSQADFEAIREINWRHGTSFVWDRDPAKMHRRLATWSGGGMRSNGDAVSDARLLVARMFGFADWNALSRAADPSSDPTAGDGVPPFCHYDVRENHLSVPGTLPRRWWLSLCDLMVDRGVTRLSAGGMTDEAMPLIAGLSQLHSLNVSGSWGLTDIGMMQLAELSQLTELEIGGPRSQITDSGLTALRQLSRLRKFAACWTPLISDQGVRALSACGELEEVNLMGTFTGDGLIESLAGKARLHRLSTGRNLTDAGIGGLHRLPRLQTADDSELNVGLMSFQADRHHVMLDGPFTDVGLTQLAGLQGLRGLSFFWHCPSFTGAGLAPLAEVPHLEFVGCQDERCDDAAMEQIGRIPKLRMLMGQGAVAGDAGFEALSRSATLEYFWGRECPNFSSRALAAMSKMPNLRGLAVSLRQVDEAALALLPKFPALRQLMPMDLTDDGFRHLAGCHQLEQIWCMYCRESGDVATESVAKLAKLKHYYAGASQITDRSLDLLASMNLLESIELWNCSLITDAGVARLAHAPALHRLTIESCPHVTRLAVAQFPARIAVRFHA
ncbi:MAG: hypothetical protein U0795_09830 [Pirellulales bacterium]